MESLAGKPSVNLDENTTKYTVELLNKAISELEELQLENVKLQTSLVAQRANLVNKEPEPDSKQYFKDDSGNIQAYSDIALKCDEWIEQINKQRFGWYLRHNWKPYPPDEAIANKMLGLPPEATHEDRVNIDYLIKRYMPDFSIVTGMTERIMREEGIPTMKEMIAKEYERSPLEATNPSAKVSDGGNASRVVGDLINPLATSPPSASVETSKENPESLKKP